MHSRRDERGPHRVGILSSNRAEIAAVHLRSIAIIGSLCGAVQGTYLVSLRKMLLRRWNIRIRVLDDDVTAAYD